MNKPSLLRFCKTIRCHTRYIVLDRFGDFSPITIVRLEATHHDVSKKLSKRHPGAIVTIISFPTTPYKTVQQITLEQLYDMIVGAVLREQFVMYD